MAKPRPKETPEQRTRRLERRRERERQPGQLEKKREYARKYNNKRYREDPEFKATVAARSKAWRDARKDTPEFKARAKENARKWREKNPDSHKDPEWVAKEKIRSRRKNYGLTHPEFIAMLERQAGLCAICARPLKPGKHTQVDHCHKTGRVRSLLCISCNLLVGRLEGPLVAEAMAYIREHASRGDLE